MEHVNEHPVKNPSAGSAVPISEQNAQLAGVSACHKPAPQPESPAQEQAAARSRDRMASYAPLRSNVSAGQTRRRVEAVVDRMIDISPSKDDPNGSYTGRPVVPGEIPVQDADDL